MIKTCKKCGAQIVVPATKCPLCGGELRTTVKSPDKSGD